MTDISDIELERRRKISVAMKVFSNTNEGRKLRSYAAKCVSKEALSKAGKKRYEDPDERSRTSLAMKKYLKDPGNKEAISRSRAKRNKTVWKDMSNEDKMKEILRMGELSKKNWKDPELAFKMLNLPLSSMNSLEKKFDMMTDDSIYYVSGSFWKVLNSGKRITPDFRVKGTMKLIELFGDYWHKGDDPTNRINLWKSVGCDCIVFWEHEILNEREKVLNLLANYVNDIV